MLQYFCLFFPVAVTVKFLTFYFKLILCIVFLLILNVQYLVNFEFYVVWNRALTLLFVYLIYLKEQQIVIALRKEDRFLNKQVIVNQVENAHFVSLIEAYNYMKSGVTSTKLQKGHLLELSTC